MADETLEDLRPDDPTEEEEEPIRLPPGWGPVLFLAAVVIASNVGLGLYLRGVMAVPSIAPPMAMGPGAGEPRPGEPKGPAGPAPAPGGTHAKASTYQADPAEFTPELDSYLKQVALEHGLPVDDIGSAREIYEQMERSGLLPQSSELDLRTVLSGHLIEMSKHRENDPAAKGPAGAPPPPADPVPDGMAPPPDVPHG